MKADKNNPFNEVRGSDFLLLPLPFLAILMVMTAMGVFVVKTGIAAGVIVFSLLIVAIYIHFVFVSPRIAIIGLFISNYFILGVPRYVPNLPIPLGMLVDLQLIIIFVALFFKSFFEKVPWKNAKSDLFLLSVIWFAWVLFQLVNPFAIARVAWFYSMRSIGLYFLLMVPAVLILFRRYNDLQLFFKIWAILSIIGAIKGIIQKNIGLDPFEDAWLQGPDRITHVLHGKIRYFSFFSDAGQYGASMGHSGVVFAILAYGLKDNRRLKILYTVASVLSLYGMMISGTRGAMFVPVMGLFLFIILQRNVKVLVAGLIMGFSIIFFFKFTSIGQSNYTIARMRTAFNPGEDASMQVRLQNQRYLRQVMRAYPIGGGIGATGPIAEKVAPNHPISKTPPDSWFVKVWMENGIVGLSLHLFILLYIVFKASYLIMFKLKDPWVKTQLTGLVSGLFGILVASYGNGVLGQMPTVIIVYSSMAFLFLGKEYDKEVANSKKQFRHFDKKIEDGQS